MELCRRLCDSLVVEIYYLTKKLFAKFQLHMAFGKNVVAHNITIGNFKIMDILSKLKLPLSESDSKLINLSFIPPLSASLAKISTMSCNTTYSESPLQINLIQAR